MLQVSERALDSATARIEVAEPLGMARDAREKSPAKREREGWLVLASAAKRDDRLAAAILALG